MQEYGHRDTGCSFGAVGLSFRSAGHRSHMNLASPGWLVEKANTVTATALLDELVEAAPYTIDTVLTDSIQFLTCRRIAEDRRRSGSDMPSTTLVGIMASSTGGELVVNEVHRRCFVRRRSRLPSLAELYLARRLGILLHS